VPLVDAAVQLSGTVVVVVVPTVRPVGALGATPGAPVVPVTELDAAEVPAVLYAST